MGVSGTDFGMGISPAFDRYPEEAALAGRIVLSYGELELLVATCLATILPLPDTANRLMFRIIGERARILAADSLMYKMYQGSGLGGEYGIAIGAVRECAKIRNQYAHCHWTDHPTAGLFFTDLQDPASLQR